jgi:hypothetical protein
MDDMTTYAQERRPADDGVFTMPWSASIARQRSTSEWPEFVCVENPHRFFPGRKAAIPEANKSDF